MSPRRTTAARAGSSRAPRARTGASVVPTLRTERRLMRESGRQLLAAVDEVGRGAFAGPVTVGVVVVDLDLGTAPQGLRDSKLLTPEARQRLAPRVRRWARAWAVGHASSAEIDELGILRALRLAGERAMADLPVRPTLVLLDGSYDWLTRPEEPPTLFDLAPPDSAMVPLPRDEPSAASAREPLSVTTMVKADLRCAGVAAASVLAKTARDALMVDLDRSHPEYGWSANKGYASPDHLEALRTLGPCALHRRSWNLRVLALREAGLLGGAGESGEPLPEELCLPEDELGDELGADALDPDDDDLLPEGMLDTQPHGLPARIG